MLDMEYMQINRGLCWLMVLDVLVQNQAAPLLMPLQEAVITVEASVGMNIQILSQEAEKIQDPTVPFKDIP